MSVLRWRFQDPSAGVAASGNYTFPLNPREMSSPFPSRAVTTVGTTAINGQVLVTEGVPQPTDWSFSGAILAQAHLEAFHTWMQYRRRIYIYDHLGRRFQVLLTKFEPVPKRSRDFPWRHDYTMNAIVFGYPVYSP